MPTKIKICGITQLEDALIAANLGANALGFIFYPKSLRYISIEKAAMIIQALPPFISKVGVFVDPIQTEVIQILNETALDVLQFHGEETPELCESFGKPYIKAIRVQEHIDILAMSQMYKTAQGLLLDTHSNETIGGSGLKFDWSLIPKNIDKPIILAGGLTPKNVAEAIKQVHPYAVDVCSGVEQSKGIKDCVKIKCFMEEVQKAKNNK